MPTLPSSALTGAVAQSIYDTLTRRDELTVRDESSTPLQVVCAWPISGQYGSGTRVLYYVLVAACLIARNKQWVKTACLAAALLLPAVAAVHGIVLAAVHVDGAVDLDVFGAFQVCSLGILAAPVAVRLSETYFKEPGRNAIFLWTGILVAGLMSLTVEFYRAQGQDCFRDDKYGPVSSDPREFPYSDDITCRMRCSIEAGPWSPLRRDPVDEIYVIPVPSKLTFGAATLLAAACCVYAILWLLSMLDKILEASSKRFRGVIKSLIEDVDDAIEGTNGATRSGMASINRKVKESLQVAVVPILSAGGLALLIIGEMNFFSAQISHKTEPMASVGQWAPIVATGLAVIGSLYLMLAIDIQSVEEEETRSFEGYGHPGGCPNCGHAGGRRQSLRGQVRRIGNAMQLQGRRHTIDASAGGEPEWPPTAMLRTTSTLRQIPTGGSAPNTDPGNRRKVARAIVSFNRLMGTTMQDLTDDSEFRRGRAMDYPEIPGEAQRNRKLSRVREGYNPNRDADGNLTPLRPSRSRASSYAGSTHHEETARGSDSSGGFRGRPVLSALLTTASEPVGSNSPPFARRSLSPFERRPLEAFELRRSRESHAAEAEDCPPASGRHLAVPQEVLKADQE